MIKYKGMEIAMVNTNGNWFGLIYKSDKLVYQTTGYSNRDFAITLTKLLADNYA